MTKHTRATGLVFVIVLISCITAAQSPTAPCDRACLNGHMERYLAALVAHDPSKVAAGATVKFTENSKVLKLGEGAWKTATGLGTFRIDFADVTGGQPAGAGKDALE